MKRKILIVVVSLFSLILLAVFSIVAYLQFVDLNRYKPQITQRLSQYLGRSVAIEGNLDIKLIPLSLSLTNAKIANASWGTRPDMLEVHQLDLQMGMLALLSGELLIYKFVLNDVQAVVEHNARGENNWSMREPKQPENKVSKETTSLPLDFVSDVEIDINNIKLQYSQLPSLPRHEFMLNKASIKGLSDLKVLQIDVSGQIDSHVYEVHGQTGSLTKLLSTDKDFPLNMKINALNTDWEVKGIIKNALRLEKIRLNVQASTKDLTTWKEWLGVSLNQGPISVNADLEGDLTKLSVSDMAIQIANTAASGDVTLDMSAEKPNIDAKLNIKDVLIKEFLDAIQSEATSKPRPESQVVDSVFFEKDLDLDVLKLFDASVQLLIESVSYEEWSVDRFTAELKMKNGQLSVAPFSIMSQLGQANGNFSLGREQDVNIAKLDIDASKLALGKFYDMASTYQGIGALQGSINTRGKSLSDLYSNLQGNAIAHYVNKEHKHDTKIALQRINPGASAAPFDVVIDGELQKVPYKITGEIGGPLALISDKPYPATAHLKFLNVNAKAKGTIAKLFEAKGFNIDVDAHTKNMAQLNQTLDLGLPALKKVQVRTVLRGDYSLLKFDRINAKSNNARLSGNIHVNFNDQLPNITGALNVDQFDLDGIQKEIAHVKKSGSGNKVKGEKRAKDGKNALTETFSFSALQDFNMNIKIQAENSDSINIPYLPVTKLSAELSVADSVLSVSPLNIVSPVGNVNSELKISAKDNLPVIEARLKSDNLDLEQITQDEGEQTIWEASASADVELHAQGDTLQRWLESVAGDVTLNYQHKQSAQNYAIHLARKAQQTAAASPVSLRINSKFRDTLFVVSGSLSAPHSWVTGTEPAMFDVNANVKGFVTEVRGKIDDLQSGQGMDIDISINNEQALNDSLGQTDLVGRVGKVQVASKIKGDYATIVASQLNGIVGNGRISGKSSINFQEQPPALGFDLDINGLDISQWFENEETTKTVTKKNKEKDKTGKLFSTEKLPYEILKGVRIKGAINGKDIQFKRVRAHEVKATVNLQEGALQFNLSRLTTTDGSLNADLKVNTKTAPPQISLEMKVPKIDMSEFARNTAAEGLVKGNFGAELSLSSAGNSMADLASGLDGHVRLLVDEGTIDSALLNVYVGGLRAMVGMLTVEKVRTTKINCGICGVQFNKGKGVSEVALIDTKHSTLVAEGWVDFNNETFSVKASPVSKGLALNMELPVVIEGPLSNPHFSTEATSALYKAAEIATVWFVPTTMIFIGYDQLRTSDQNPCVNMVAPTKDRAGMRAIKGAGKAVKDIGSAFTKSLSKLLGGKSEAETQIDEKASDTNQ